MLFVSSVVTMSGSCKLKQWGSSWGELPVWYLRRAGTVNVVVEFWDPPHPHGAQTPGALRWGCGCMQGGRKGCGVLRFLEKEDQTHSNPRSASRRRWTAEKSKAEQEIC